MNIVVILVSLVTSSVSGQAQVTRVCSLQVVVDNLLWQQQRQEAEVQEQEEEEVDRITRFNIISLISRIVNRANRVLDDYAFNNGKYKLNFHGGSIGLAWTATTTNGGVCDKHGLHHDEEGGGGHVNKSLNTGVVSLSRNHLQVSERVASLTFSHEVAHSFGSPHDSGGCVGGGEAGHHLMHDTGSLGLQPNNMRLSRCSRANMTRVVASRHCWTVDTHGHCGNGIVEAWESCDCGHVDTCRDTCCVPQGDPHGRRPCTLVEGAQCSPSEGSCCDAKCRFLSSETVCSPASNCSLAVQCHGRNAICPLPQTLPDNTPCQDNSRTCLKGECIGSICLNLGLTPCYPSETDSTTAACSPHCRGGGPGAACLPVTNVSYAADSECQVGGGYGHCSPVGLCQVGGMDTGPGWLVGLVLFLVFYLLASLAVLYIYCMYCRGGRIRPVAMSSLTGSEDNQG